MSQLSAEGPRRPHITCSKRFEKSFRKCSAPLQGLAEGAIHDLVNRFRADRPGLKRAYDRLAQLTEVIEIDVAGACRMLAIVEDDDIHLLNVGGHDIVPSYTAGHLMCDRLSRMPVRDSFWPDAPVSQVRFFTRSPCVSYSEYGPESVGEWLYFLSDQQAEVAAEVVLNLEDRLNRGLPTPPVFLIGGPGTGKTSVLINILKELVDKGVNARIRLSAKLIQYINACVPEIEIERLVQPSPAHDAVDVLLTDDPADLDAIKHDLQMIQWKQAKTVIFAFDPCQLSSFDPKRQLSGITDDEFCDLVRDSGGELYDLSVCYRQKQNVGLASKKVMDVIADSTPFLARDKIEQFRTNHLGVTSISNGMEFPNPFGYCQVHVPATAQAIEGEFRRIKEKPLWSHWPPLLLVFEHSVIDAALPLIAACQGGVQAEVALTEQAEAVKGLEYQHAFLFITRKLFDQLEQGFEGSGQALYSARRLLRIPYSRAKDSVVVFVFDP